MDLIERYIEEVARRLPKNQSDDVTRELRSSLEDSLEARSGVPIGQADEDLAAEILVEFGPPREVADSYRSGPNHLIGPSLYPTFVRAMKLGLLIVGGLIAFGVLVDLAGSSTDAGSLARIAARALSDVQTGFLGLLGLVVLVFAIIERSASPPEIPERIWDPRDLPPLAGGADRVDRAGTVVGLVLGGLALILINMAPDWIQIQVWSDGDHFSAPLLGSALQTDVAILNVYLALGLAIGGVLLLQKRWRVMTRAADAATSGLLVALLWRLWAKSDLLVPAESDLIAEGWPTEEAANFAEVSTDVLSPMLWWLLLAGLIAAAWVSARKVLALIRTARTAPSAAR
ncbi:MAG: hypothetical protein GY722_23140 [bacterium]|nr:hypothetical protein [bacterium]